MASNRPVLHGPDHLPGGPDPIPLLATTLGVEYVYLASNGSITIPDTGTEVAFDFQGGVSSAGAAALTANPEVFETAVMATGPFAGNHGLKINETGLYAVFSEISTASPDESGAYVPKAQSMSFEFESAGSFSQSNMTFSGSFDQAVYGKQAVLEMWAIGGSPVTVGLSAQNNRGAATGDVDVNAYLLVVRLSSQAMDDFPVLF